MFCVYWTQPSWVGFQVKSRLFDDCKDALDWCEVCRSKKFRFVSLVSEIPGNVTKMGVAKPNIEYDWKKRRI